MCGVQHHLGPKLTVLSHHLTAFDDNFFDRTYISGRLFPAYPCSFIGINKPIVGFSFARKNDDYFLAFDWRIRPP